MDGRFRTMTHPGLSPAVTVTVFPSGKMRIAGYRGASFDMMRTCFERVFECLQWKQAPLRPDAQDELEWLEEVANPTDEMRQAADEHGLSYDDDTNDWEPAVSAGAPAAPAATAAAAATDAEDAFRSGEARYTACAAPMDQGQPGPPLGGCMRSLGAAAGQPEPPGGGYRSCGAATPAGPQAVEEDIQGALAELDEVALVLE